MGRGRTNERLTATSEGVKFFFGIFCFEMVHFGAKVTDAVHHH